jgi:hypothetical protein
MAADGGNQDEAENADDLDPEVLSEKTMSLLMPAAFPYRLRLPQCAPA